MELRNLIKKVLKEDSHRVMGFRYKKPETRARISLIAPDAGNLKFKLRDVMDEMSVEVNHITGGGGRFNSYIIDINVYDEVEVQKIISDLRLKLMLNNINIEDVTYSII